MTHIFQHPTKRRIFFEAILAGSAFCLLVQMTVTDRTFLSPVVAASLAGRTEVVRVVESRVPSTSIDRVLRSGPRL